MRWATFKTYNTKGRSHCKRASTVKGEEPQSGYPNHGFQKAIKCTESYELECWVAGMRLTLFILLVLDACRWSAGTTSLRTPISAGRRWKPFCWEHSRTDERVGEPRRIATSRSQRAGADMHVLGSVCSCCTNVIHIPRRTSRVSFVADVSKFFPDITQEMAAPTKAPRVGVRRRCQQDLSRRSPDQPLRS